MTLKSAPYYWHECDRCGISAQDGSDHSAWMHADTADIEPEEQGWHLEGGNAVCQECMPLDPEEYEYVTGAGS